MSLTWEGVFCALWTPTDRRGRLIKSALRANLEFLKGHHLQGLLALGSTGEFLYLEPRQRQALIQSTVEAFGPLPLILNLSDLRPRVVAGLAHFARQSGAAAVSLLPPYFYPVAPPDQVEFFVRAAEVASLPLFLYNFPERTGNRISLGTISAVADRVPLAGVKQSGAEFAYHSALVELGRKKNFVVLTGADTRLPEAVSLGVAGCVSGLANAVPDLVLQSLAEARQRLTPDARLASSHLSELAQRISTVNFPLDVAACMEARGLEVGAPKAIISPATQDRYAALVRELRSLFAEWKLI